MIAAVPSRRVKEENAAAAGAMPPSSSISMPITSAAPPTVPQRLHVVVDRGFGPRLSELPPDEPAWVVDSPENAPAARRLQEQRRASNSGAGIITFGAEAGSSPERLLILQLGPIDMRHGVYSGCPPFSLLTVIGCHPSRAVRLALADYGLVVGETTAEGFTALRSPES